MPKKRPLAGLKLEKEDPDVVVDSKKSSRNSFSSAIALQNELNTLKLERLKAFKETIDVSAIDLIKAKSEFAK